MNATGRIEVVKAVFGDHPEGVIGVINSAADALQWLEEILQTISREALDERKGYRIKRLAEAGAHLAQDMGDYTGCRHEEMMAKLREAGVAFPGT